MRYAKAEERLAQVLLQKLSSEIVELGSFLSQADFRMNNRPVAQLAERRSPKPKVGGSMPSWPARFNSLQVLAIIDECL